ncbi:MAG TPA: HYR domain-containing protein, partial [Vicinamibacterales bacterium]|nr:HYR domain-containing protein [Vicinamibacterales bacterium]
MRDTAQALSRGTSLAVSSAAMFRFRLLLGCCLCAILLVCAHRADAESLTVGWDTVSGVAGYVVSYGTNEGNYTTNVDAGNQTQKQIDGLASGTMYYFVVRSYDGAGHLSNPSADVAGMTSGTPSTPPSIECPTPVAASPDGKPVAAIFSASVFGGTAPVNVSCSPASGSLFPVGSTPASCTATDALQLTASCNTTVVVTYNAPSGPAPLTMMCPAPSATSGDGKPVVVTFAPNVAGGTAPISTSCAPASGSTFAVGSTAFTCRSVDAKSVSASCTSSVTVSSAASPNPNPTPAPAPGLSPVNAPLAISCPLVDPVISQSGAAMPVTFAPAVTGGIAPITTSCLPASGTSFAVGATGVVCSVTDGARQIDSC